MKKILALFLVLATVLSLMTVGAYAAADNALSVSCKLYDGYTVVTVQKSGTVYYTTDGTKPTDKSQEASLLIKFTEPCKLRTVCYFDGKPIKYLNKTIKIKEKKPEKFTLTTKVSTGSTMVSVKKPKDSVVY